MSDDGADERGGKAGDGPEPLSEFLARHEGEERMTAFAGDESGPGQDPVARLVTPIEDELLVADEPPSLRAVEIYEPAPLAGSPRLGVLEERERRRRRGYLLGGVAVTALGLALFVAIAVGLSLAGLVFLAPAVLLLVLAAAWRPYYWLYLPGFALLGFGLGWVVDDALTPEPDVWLSWVGLGAGLLVAWGLRFAQGRRGHWLAPVAGVTAVTAGLLAGVDDLWAIVWKGWPLIVVAIGVALVVRALTMGRRKGGGGPPAVR